MVNKKLILVLVMSILLACSASALTAVGGTITYFANVTGNYTVHTFTSDGYFNVTAGPGDITYLLVAGGGQGGDDNGATGGAGGAGGLLHNTTSISSGNYPIVVGIGGYTGGDDQDGQSGFNTTFNSLKAIGGGGGGNYFGGGDGNPGLPGGSGGGAGSADAANKDAGGVGVVGQGYNGSNSGVNTPGGGGGAGGYSGTISGGVGINISINGSIFCYAGGGSSYTGGAGTAVCGGAYAASGQKRPGTNGTGGGGAGGWASVGGGPGGTGIVIIQYRIADIPLDHINLSAAEPATDTQFNFNDIVFNLTMNNTYSVNASLYINGILNETKVYATGIDNLVNFSKSLAEGTYNFSINCVQANDSSQSESSTTNTFYIDPVNPVITTNYINLSFYYSQNITGEFNFTDSFLLYSYNISIDSVQIAGATDLNTTFVNYTLNYDISNLSIGAHTLTVRTADGHTAKELGGDYDVSNGIFNDYLEFEFYDGGSVKMTSLPGSLFDSFTAEKQIDRYTFDYEPNDKEADSYSFEVEADESIEIVEVPGHYNDRWLIIDGRKWLDFVLDNEPNVEVSIARINAKKVNVTITGLAYKDLLSFSSIGDLNIVEQNYTFYNTNSTLTFVSPVLMNDNQTMTFNINKTGSILYTNATLNYNGTNKTVIKTEFGGYDSYVATFQTPPITVQEANVSFNWSFTITGSVNNFSSLIQNNQTVLQIGLDNCSTYTNVSVNFTMFLENDNSLLNSDVDGYFRIWRDDISAFRSFNLSWFNNSNPQICLNPSWASYNIYGQMEYVDTPGVYDKKTYYFFNATFNNITQQVNLFLTNGTSQVTFSVTDENDDPISDVYVSVLSYDLGTNSYRTTEIIKTDTDGEALGQVRLNDWWYQFVLNLDGENKLLTEPTKITSLSKFFRINLGANYFTNFDTYLGVATTLIYTNATNTFRYTFSNPSGSPVNGCLKIVKRTANGDSILNQSCVTSASSTISLSMTPVLGTTYLGVGYLKVNPDYVTDILEYLFGGRHEVFGLEGVFVSFLLVVGIVMAGVWSPVVAIVMALIALIASSVIGLFYLSWPILSALLIVGGITLYRLSR